MKATEQNFPVVLFIMLYKVVLTFESVDETLWSDHSNETSLPALTPGASCFSKFHKMKFGIFFVEFYLWPNLAVKWLKTEQCDRSIPTSTAIRNPSSSSWSLLAFRSSLSCYKKKDLIWTKEDPHMNKIQWHYTAAEIKCHYSDVNYLR